MEKKFRCDCTTHLLEISYYKDKEFPSELWIDIYDIYNPKTGRKYKKPKLIADTVLMNNHYPKELTKFVNFIKKLESNKEIVIFRCANCGTYLGEGIWNGCATHASYCENCWLNKKDIK